MVYEHEPYGSFMADINNVNLKAKYHKFIVYNI